MVHAAAQYTNRPVRGRNTRRLLRKPMNTRPAGKDLSAEAPVKDLYEIGEIPPLGHVPKSMYAWVVRKERHGPPEEAMKIEVVPDLGARQPRRARSRDGGGRQLQRRLGGARRAGLRRSTCTRIPITSRAPTPRASSGRSAPRSSAGRSATRSSSTATRTTATTRNATAATRCSRRRSASGATRRRTARSPSSAACRTAS